MLFCSAALVAEKYEMQRPLKFSFGKERVSWVPEMGEGFFCREMEVLLRFREEAREKRLFRV
jgi:hypothetical protein